LPNLVERYKCFEGTRWLHVQGVEQYCVFRILRAAVNNWSHETNRRKLNTTEELTDLRVSTSVSKFILKFSKYCRKIKYMATEFKPTYINAIQINDFNCRFLWFLWFLILTLFSWIPFHFVIELII
jgi:hypothetical protein